MKAIGKFDWPDQVLIYDDTEMEMVTAPDFTPANFRYLRRPRERTRRRGAQPAGAHDGG